MTGTLVAFLVASVAVILLPGPDMMLLLKNAATGGRAVAAATVAGIMTGNAVLCAAAALGLTAVLLASGTVFEVLRIVGGLYLMYLGSRALLAWARLRGGTAGPGASEASWPGHASRNLARRAAFRQGLLCNVLNPKAAAFYLALFPQFEVTALPPTTSHLVLAAAFWLLCLCWYVGVLTVLGRLGRVLSSPVVARRAEATTGGVLLGLGGLVVLRPAP
ncbi:LysE family translocator [Nocardioides sp. CFH 31398]|uniref:LysE family translocator n=1 Tax=Nocardioides sp. CFH 31398 TaxID=2919579 RepID=UPI001F067762|nr:LysE family translocator [Nocardioides sp. CFH 31398]MCH1867200.1 LysE family translocator [Nocardioides sp. CFH 31398]